LTAPLIVVCNGRPELDGIHFPSSSAGNHHKAERLPGRPAVRPVSVSRSSAQFNRDPRRSGAITLNTALRGLPPSRGRCSLQAALVCTENLQGPSARCLANPGLYIVCAAARAGLDRASVTLRPGEARSPTLLLQLPPSNSLDRSGPARKRLQQQLPRIPS